MSSTESQWQWQRPRRFGVLCIFVSQLDPMEPPNSSVRFCKDVEIGNRSVMPVIKYVLLKLIHCCRCWIDHCGAAMIPIHLLLFQRNGTRLSVHSPIKFCGELNLVSERRFMVPKLLLSSETRTATDIIEGYLSSMHISEKMHPEIIQEIYDEAQVADPALPIDVTMVNVTVWVLGKPPSKSKSKSSSSSSSVVGGLENVRRDCLESCIRQQPCAICQESLDVIYDAQEGFTRLPCLHIFHRDCLVQCLEMSPECPVCKYPLPQLGEPSGHLHWPMLLIMSAAGILTARLLFRLLKRGFSFM